MADAPSADTTKTAPAAAPTTPTPAASTAKVVTENTTSAPSLNATEQVSPTFFIPESTRDNYLQIARDAAAATGKSAKECLVELAEDFERRHAGDPTGGYDHLAAWATTADPDAAAGPSALALATPRAVQPARRDPGYGLTGQPQVVAVAVETIQAEPATAVGGIDTDASTGVVPNPGPVAVETASAGS